MSSIAKLLLGRQHPHHLTGSSIRADSVDLAKRRIAKQHEEKENTQVNGVDIQPKDPSDVPLIDTDQLVHKPSETSSCESQEPQAALASRPDSILLAKTRLGITDQDLGSSSSRLNHNKARRKSESDAKNRHKHRNPLEATVDFLRRKLHILHSPSGPGSKHGLESAPHLPSHLKRTSCPANLPMGSKSAMLHAASPRSPNGQPAEGTSQGPCSPTSGSCEGGSMREHGQLQLQANPPSSNIPGEVNQGVLGSNDASMQVEERHTC